MLFVQLKTKTCKPIPTIIQIQNTKMIKETARQKAWDNINIVDVFKDNFRDTTLTKKGRDYVCICPFHNDHTPSLHVEPYNNKVHCYACGKDLYLFDFVMEVRGVSYPEAVKYLYENFLRSENIQDIYEESTPEDKAKRNKRQKYVDCMKKVQSYYRTEYDGTGRNSVFCRDYAEKRPDNPNGRWSKDICDSEVLGYSQPSGHSLMDWAKDNNIRCSMLEELGLLGISSSSTGMRSYYEVFTDRLMTPLRDDNGIIIGYTGRRLDGKKELRHVNTRNTILFDKSRFVFNFYKAKRVLHTTGKCYLMEGHGDVLALNDLGILNACASMGSSWTESQLLKFKPYSPTLCFIPDADTGMREIDGVMLRKGESFAITNAKLALSLGFDVSIREIPGSDKEKRDVNSYVKSKEIWDSLEEETFVIWYAKKILDLEAPLTEVISKMTSICRLLVLISDEVMLTGIFNRLKKIFRDKDNWNTAYNKARQEQEEEKAKAVIRKSNIDTKRYHIVEIDNCYYYLKDINKTDKTRITNFKITPLYLIKTEAGSKRIVELTNEDGMTEIVEFDSKEVSRYDKFVDKVTSVGRFDVIATQNQYNESLRSMMINLVTTLEYLEVLGQSKDGSFIAYSNGIGDKNGWHESDAVTHILKYMGRNYYFPDNNEIRNRMCYHPAEQETSMFEFFSLIVSRFRENGIISIAYVLATINRDIITRATRFFPILFFYGNTGSGKTELAVTLTKLFRAVDGMLNMTSASVFSIGQAMTEMNNGLTVIEEYNEEITREKNEIFKGAYDLTGRYVRDDINGMRKEYKTNTGLILTGNHIPDYDRALLTRTIFLEFFKITRTDEGRKEIDRLKQIREQGIISITIGLLRFRENFEKNFRKAWDDALTSIKVLEDMDKVEERIQECWAVAYATVLCYNRCGVQLPFSPKDVLDAAILGMFRQHDVLKTSDIATIFWKSLNAAYKKGKLVEGSHFIIKAIGNGLKVSKNRKRHTITSDEGLSEYITLEIESCMEISNAQLIKRREIPLKENAVMRFLENSNEHLGNTFIPMRFAVLDDNNRPIKKSFVDSKTKKKCTRQEYIVCRSIAFNYDMIKSKYGIDFSTVYVTTYDETSDISNTAPDMFTDIFEPQ